MKIQEKKSFNVPHIYVLLVGLILICVAATWILPAGEFERQEVNGRMLVVPGTYHSVNSNPIGFMDGVLSIYKGMNDAAGIVFFVFIAYASIGLIIKTGAFNGLVAYLLRIMKGKVKVLIIPIFITLIGICSSTVAMFEETYPFIPIFVGIATAMGYDAIVGMSIIGLAAGIGYSGAVINPFTVGIAQSIAELPPLSGSGYRAFSHLVMILVASAYTMRYALAIEKDPTKSLVYGDDIGDLRMDAKQLEKSSFGAREIAILLTLVFGIILIVWGVKVQGWYFGEIAAIFLVMGIFSGFLIGWSPNNIASKWADGLSEIAMACIMIGLARAILVVLREGRIIDTIVYGLSIPMSMLPKILAAQAMLVIQTLINFVIPSGSGQAATSMPIMAPLADLLGISRQTAILAFQFGDGLSNILWPTASMPILCGLARVKIDKWLKWFIPLFGMLFITQMLLIWGALLINYQ